MVCVQKLLSSAHWAKAGLVFILLAGLPTLVSAQDLEYNPALVKKWTLSAGIFGNFIDAEVSSESVSAATRGIIDFNALGIDNESWTPFVFAKWRMSEKFHLNLGYFRSELDGTRTVSKTINFRDLTINPSASVSPKLRIDDYVIGLGYSVVKKENWELGLFGGVHIFDISTKISAEIGPGNWDSAKAEVTAPLPYIGLFGTLAVTDKLALRGSVGWLGFEYDKYDFELLTAQIAAEYWFNDRFALGAGYNFIDLDLDVTNNVYKETFDFRLGGPIIYGSLGF